MRFSDEDTPPPYVVSYAETGEAELDAAFRAFASRNPAAAERWLGQVHNALSVRAADHAAVAGRRYIADDADTFPNREIHVVRVGAWRVLYELIDTDGDVLMDTLSVAYVRPAAQNNAADNPTNE